MVFGFIIPRADAGLIPANLQAQNFTRFALGDDFKGVAAHFTISRKTLRSDAGINDQFTALAAKRTKNRFRDFHSAYKLNRFRRVANFLMRFRVASNQAKRALPFVALGNKHSDMNFPQFWAKGGHDHFTCWPWSNHSVAEARTLANEAARKLAERFASKGGLSNDRYGYANRPMREPVLREFKDATGNMIAAITRNSHGCLVLNTARAMFVDVDLPEPKSSSGGLFGKLFGKKTTTLPNDAQTRALAQAETWAQKNPGWGWRVYRTRAGLRLLATHGLFDPDAASTETAFEALTADPLYRRLCQSQKCFRARLSPKPWRCDVEKPPSRWPWMNAKAEAQFQRWEKKYISACNEFATCDLVATYGNTQIHSDIQAIIRVHDEATRVESKLALA